MIERSKCEKVIPKGGRGFWGGRAVSPLRNLGSYACGAAGADKLIGHPDQLDVVVLGYPAHHVEGLVGVDFVAFHQDALSLPNDRSVQSADAEALRLLLLGDRYSDLRGQVGSGVRVVLIKRINVFRIQVQTADQLGAG